MRYEEEVDAFRRRLRMEQNKKIAKELCDRHTQEYMSELRKAHWGADSRVQGVSKNRSMRHVARVPINIYMTMCEIEGPDYWTRPSTIKKMQTDDQFKQFLAVERL